MSVTNVRSAQIKDEDVATTDIANGAVTLAKMANMATASLIYRKTAGDGAPEVNTLATLKTDLGPYIRSYTWIVSNPVAGTIGGPRLPEARTVTRVDAYCVGGTSVTFQLTAGSDPSAAGSNILSSSLVADADGAYTTSFTAKSSLSSGDWLKLVISSISGNPTQLVVTMTCEVS